MVFRYSQWDGSQSINPLSEDELLDALSRDLLEEGDLRNALERLLMRGMQRPDGQRSAGVRNLMDRLRERREQELQRHNLGGLMDDINERLQEIVDQERRGIEQRRESGASDPEADQSMRDLLQQMTQRKLDSLDSLPQDTPGQLQQLMNYEFMDQDARQEFQDLVNDLRQQMMGEQFRNMQQGLESLSAEDLEPIREMIQELNQLLAKHVRGAATEQDFRQFMDRFGHMFPPGIENLEDLVEYLEQQAEQMASLLMSMPEEMRDQLMQTMAALLQDDRLQDDLMQMSDLIEQITGRPLGRRYPFSGDNQLGLDDAMEVMRGLNDVDELERQLRQAMRNLDFDNVDWDMLRDVLGQEAADSLSEMRQISRMLEDSGLATRRGNNDLELTPRAIRRLGERTLRELFAELRQDRLGEHEERSVGASSEQVSDTKPWEFGDPFLVDIGASIGNAVRRAGPGIPVKIEAEDLEVHKRESLIDAATVICLDMSRSMFMNGAFIEAKRVALALNTLIKTRFPRDNLLLVVFSHYAMQLDPSRLLQSDWVDWSGTNIAAALQLSRGLLSKRKSSNRQIILITDWRPRRWGGWDYGESAVEEALIEVKRCTQAGIRINTFMMDNDPASMALAQAMMKMNKGRVFYGAANRMGRYVLVDFLKNRRRRL